MHGAGIRTLVRSQNCRGGQLPFLFVASDHRGDGFRQQFKLIGDRACRLADKLEVQPVRCALCNPASKFAELRVRDHISCAIRIQLRQLLRRDKSDAGSRSNVIDVSPKSLECGVGFLRRSLRGRFPLFPWRIRTAREIDSVPELLMHPLAGMIKNADQSAAVFAAQTFDNRRDLFLGWFLGCGIVQFHASVVSSHVINIQRGGIPKRLLVQPHVRSFIDVAGHAMWCHADLPEPSYSLRAP